METIKTEHGQVEYLNSGDWIENLTALEYHNEKWTLFKYDPVHFIEVTEDEADDVLVLLDNQAIFNQMLGGFLKNKDIVTTFNFTK